MQELAPWLAGIVALCALVYTIIANNSKASSYRLRQIEAKIDGKASKEELDGIRTQVAGCVGRVDIVEDRVSRIETEMEHLPDKDTMHTLALQVSEQRSDIRALATSVDNIRKSVDHLTRTVEENGEQPRRQ